MRPGTKVTVLLAFFGSVSLTGQTAVEQRTAQHDERGFVAEKAYQFDGIDSVHLFNGNLTLTVPLGGTYPVSSNLSYGLKLYYNSKVWELIEGGQNTCVPGQGDSPAAFPARAAHWRASAGLGWTFSLGHLVSPSQNSLNNHDSYISPDGARHLFSARQTLTGVPGYSAVAYADDAHLRLKVTNAGQYEVEFPDGTTHTFGADGFLLRMSDRFDNAVQVSNAVVNGTWIWTLTDPHRLQIVRLKDAWPELDAANRFESLRWIVESIDLAAFSPDGTSQPVGRYEFAYAYQSVARGCGSGTVYDPCSGTPEVPLLEAIKWVPDGSTFTFEYNTTTGLECQQGTLSKVTLPTGGAIGWTYGTYTLPTNGCGWNPFTGAEGVNRTVGVRKKTLYDAAGSEIGEWTYTPELGPLTQTEGMCAEIEPIGGGQPVPVTHRGYQHVTNTVTDPLDRATVNYFATWTDDVVSTAGNWERDYGLPFTRMVATGQRFLSTKVCEEGASPCEAVRTTYVAYDDAAAQLAPRLMAERTVFNDDADHYLDSASSNYDGLGHYRTSTVSSSFAPTRTSFRDVNGEAGQPTIAVEDPWLLNLYTTEEVTEGPATSVVRVCFDEVTGALLGKRSLQGTTLHEKDVVVRYGYENGDPVSEDWYGGDENLLVSNDLCAAPPAQQEASQYRIDHDYTAGVRESSQYRNTTFKSFDLSVDARSGLASSSRDGAGAAATYAYDKLGRIEAVRPSNEVWTHYTYETTSRPATVIVRSFGPAVTDPSTATPITERRHYYDGLGRLIQTREQMPGGWSVVNHTYDEAGQRTTTSIPEMRTGGAYEGAIAFTPAHATQFAFDRFGRARSTTTPDGKTSTITYTGARVVERTVDVGGTEVTTLEEYDAHGRLIGVTEDAVETFYGYDVGNRLTSVTMTKGSVTQSRTFLYDNRGFLLFEQHPEKGSDGNGGVLYGAFEGSTFVPAYDARGHALRKIDGPTGGPHDLKLTYDEAERLTRVEDLDANGNRRTIKEFHYADTNVPASCLPGDAGCNATKGKLVSAVRYNRPPNLGEIGVTETYEYKGLGGRPTRRLTTVGETDFFASATFTLNQTWDENGFLSSLTYPSTPASLQTRTVTFGYTKGLLTAVNGYGTITYQPNGLIDTVTHGTGPTAVTEKWISDPQKMARPLRIEVAGPNGLDWTYGDYAYDGAGNITATGTRSYTYDGMNRLTGWTNEHAGGFGTTSLQIDPFGNHLGSTFRSCGPLPQRLCYTTTFPPLAVDSETNHYSSATYDEAGSVTGDGLYSYGYDATAMMTSLTGSGRDERYLYTADDERIAIVDRIAHKTTWTLRGTDNRLLRTFTRASVSSNTGWAWVEDEIWRGNQLLASESQDGLKHYHLDHLGSPRLITDADGNRLGEQDFLPFGHGGTTDGGRLQFTGHERDIAANRSTRSVLDYMHARYYSPGLGRFLSVDPAMDLEKILPEPQLWNRYAYASNNPLKYLDPDGQERQIPRSALNWTSEQARRNAANVNAVSRFLKSVVHFDDVRDALAGFRSAPANEKLLAVGIVMIATADVGANVVNPEKLAGQKAGAIMLGSFPKYIEMGERLGARVFDIDPRIYEGMSEAARWIANKKFLDDAVLNGDVIVLSDDPSGIIGKGFKRELEYLMNSLGFRPEQRGDIWVMTR